jgi:hypothetical protein
MSFKTLKKEDLLYAAEFANIDVSDCNTNVEIIAALEEGNFTWASYKKFIDADKRKFGESQEDLTNRETGFDQSVNVQFNQMVLLKMERKNGTFEILGRRFTNKQPFQVMSPDEAQEIIDLADTMGGGFRIATPAEAKSYFG